LKKRFNSANQPYIMKHLLLAVVLAAFGLKTMAQQTGDYTITIPTFEASLNGDSLDIYFHVPSTYNANEPSKIILGFHGLGNPNNSDQIRNYLSPLGDSLNAIVVCPDPYLQDQPRSEVVLNLAYDSVMTWFNIDTNQVTLRVIPQEAMLPLSTFSENHRIE
jgi:poly(3-hydroxybutyrate) depolymerase